MGIMKRLIILRHGQSTSNQTNTFGGWIDSELSAQGQQEASSAQPLLKEFFGDKKPCCIYTSRLKRAINTCDKATAGLGWDNIPRKAAWQLNERMYGAFQGKNKAELGAEIGADELKKIRRAFDIPPPPLDRNSEFHPLNDPQWKDLDPAQIPDTESLKICQERVMIFWQTEILQQFIKNNCEDVVIFAHGNSLRALVHKLEGLTLDELLELNIPTAVPRVLEFDDDMTSVQRAYYLGDPDAIAAAAAAVANQGAAK